MLLELIVKKTHGKIIIPEIYYKTKYFYEYQSNLPLCLEPFLKFTCLLLIVKKKIL